MIDAFFKFVSSETFMMRTFKRYRWCECDLFKSLHCSTAQRGFDKEAYGPSSLFRAPPLSSKVNFKMTKALLRGLNLAKVSFIWEISPRLLWVCMTRHSNFPTLMTEACGNLCFLICYGAKIQTYLLGEARCKAITYVKLSYTCNFCFKNIFLGTSKKSDLALKSKRCMAKPLQPLTFKITF